MKLWRRRPLSVDLTDKSIGGCNEMPPSLVYISPGIQCISKRSSLTNNEILKHQYFSDVSSFNSIEKRITTRSNTMENCPFQSFRDNSNNITVSFEEGTIRSSRLTNKSYISPMSAEWLPVKDVMKIKRSASVPFHSAQNVTSTAKPTIESPSVSVKSHSSLAEKIRTLFRTRSSSRSSKTVLTPINENKGNKGNVCLRNSRTRTKEIEACKSMYESSRVHDHEFSEKLNHVLRDCAKRPTEHISNKDARKIQNEKSNKKKDKSVINDKKQKLKDYHIHWDGQKISSSKGFSDSVVSHTASSAAKCKPSPPKLDHDVQRIKCISNYRSGDNQVDKKPIVKSNSCKYELQLSRESSQPITAQNYDKKSCELNKSDPVTGNGGRIDNGKVPQRRESRVLNQSAQPSEHCKDERPDISKRTSSIQKPDEDDYVTLAQVDLQAPYSFMSQSIHDPIIRELSKSNHEYENIDLRKLPPPSDSKQQSPVILKYSNSSRDPDLSSGIVKQKRRPISMVEAEKCKPPTPGNRYSSREPPRNMNPKSPYLSQYTKLYSLKLTNGEILYTQQPDPLDLSEIMTRSQTSCPYKCPTTLGKEATGKRSIDSGMVDDLSITFHQDNVIQT